MIKHLTCSKINTFYNCPRAFKFQMEGQREIRVDDSKAQFGKAVHDIIKCFYSKPGKPPEEAWDEAVKENSANIPRYLKRNLKSIKQCFLNFAETYPPPKFVEKKFKAKLFDDLPEFVGIIDAFYHEGIVVDWKTGNIPMGNGHLIQGKIYQMLLEKNGYKVDKVYMVYLYHDIIKKVPKVTDGYIRKIASHMLTMIKNKHFPPKKSGLCDWCPYRLSCEFIDTPYWVVLEC